MQYPLLVRFLLGPIKGGNCRNGYGLAFMQQTHQTCCAYCGMNFTECYEDWLQMSLDHVVPKSVCKSLVIRKKWMDDYANCVLACAACNAFSNRYKAPEGESCPISDEAFFDLRDKIFAERRILVAKRREEDKAIFQMRKWELPL